MDNTRTPHPAIELVHLHDLALVEGLVMLRDALPGGGAPPEDVPHLRRALHVVGSLVLEEGHFPARRVLADALASKVAFPTRMAFRLGEPRADRDRFHELVRRFVAAEVFGGESWEDFAWRARLFVELQLVRTRYVEQQLLVMAPLRLDTAQWRRLDGLASLHLPPDAAVGLHDHRSLAGETAAALRPAA